MMSDYVNFMQSIGGNHIPTWDELPDLELYMDQVIVYLERQLEMFVINRDSEKIITPAMINNYVKLGMIPPPVRKKYCRDHLAYLIIICIAKPVLSIPSISQMIEPYYKSGNLPQLLGVFGRQQEQALVMAGDFLKTRSSDKNDDELTVLQLTSLACGYQLAAKRLIANKEAELSIENLL